MVWQIVACVLASAGLLLFLWCLIGSFVLPVAGRSLTAVYRASGSAGDLEQTVRGFSWLRGTGMIDMPLQILDCGMDPQAAMLARQLAKEHPYIQIIWQAGSEGRVNGDFGGTAGTDPRQCGGGGLSE